MAAAHGGVPTRLAQALSLASHEVLPHGAWLYGADDGGSVRSAFLVDTGPNPVVSLWLNIWGSHSGKAIQVPLGNTEGAFSTGRRRVFWSEDEAFSEPGESLMVGFGVCFQSKPKETCKLSLVEMQHSSESKTGGSTSSLMTVP